MSYNRYVVLQILGKSHSRNMRCVCADSRLMLLNTNYKIGYRVGVKGKETRSG